VQRLDLGLDGSMRGVRSRTGLLESGSIRAPFSSNLIRPDSGPAKPRTQSPEPQRGAHSPSNIHLRIRFAMGERSDAVLVLQTLSAIAYASSSVPLLPQR
jgi:hypothetical protein